MTKPFPLNDIKRVVQSALASQRSCPMLHESLQAVVGTAVIDAEFRKALLNGSCQRVIQCFNLSREEFDAVMGVRADSLEQFAGQLDQWILRAQGKLEPPTLVSLPYRRRTFAGTARWPTTQAV